MQHLRRQVAPFPEVLFFLEGNIFDCTRERPKDGPALEAGIITDEPKIPIHSVPCHSCRKQFIHNVLTLNRCTQTISQVTFDYHLSLEPRLRLKPNLRVFKLAKCPKRLCPAICQWCKLVAAIEFPKRTHSLISLICVRRSGTADGYPIEIDINIWNFELKTKATKRIRRI